METAERALASVGRIAGVGDNYQAGIYWLTGLKLPWMLVLDNADDHSIDYSKFFPGGDNGHILLTSRLRDCRTHATVGSHEFRNMDEDDAVLLLLRSAGNNVESQASREIAKTIAKALGYLPLALAQAGACVRQNICSLEEYLPLYESHRTDLLKRRIVQNSESHHQSVFTAFDVSVQKIQCETSQATTDALEILQILAFLHFEQAPISLFSRAWHNTRRWPESMPPKTIVMRAFESIERTLGSSLSRHLATYCPRSRLPDVLRGYAPTWNSFRFREALCVLQNYSLVYRDVGEAETYSMHPLIHSWARDRLSLTDQHVWVDIATNTLAASIREDFAPSDKAYRISLVPHINACLKNKIACTIFQQRLNPYQIAKSTKFACIFSEGGYFGEAAKLQECIIGAASSQSRPSDPGTLDVMISLADSYWNLDQVKKSLKLLSAVVKSSERMVGSDDPRTLRAKDKLAGALWLIGQRTEARDLSAEAVTKMGAILGPSHPFTLDGMDTFGRTLLHLGLPREAEKLHRAVLAGREKFLGPSHPDTLIAMANLGMSYHAQRRFEEAEELLDVVFHKRSRILGEEHAYTLWAINDLAKIRCDHGRPAEAEGMLTGILDIVTRTLGADHIGMSMTKQNLARAYSAQERWTDSRRVMLELMAIQERKMPPTHPDRIAAAVELARVTRHLGDLESAERMFETAIELCSQVHGPKDQRTMKAMGQLAVVYIDMGRLAEAEALDRKIGEA